MNVIDAKELTRWHSQRHIPTPLQVQPPQLSRNWFSNFTVTFHISGLLDYLQIRYSISVRSEGSVSLSKSGLGHLVYLFCIFL